MIEAIIVDTNASVDDEEPLVDDRKPLLGRAALKISKSRKANLLGHQLNVDVPIFSGPLIVDRNPLIVDREPLIAKSFSLIVDRNSLIDNKVPSPTPFVPCIRGGMHVTIGRKLY